MMGIDIFLVCFIFSLIATVIITAKLIPLLSSKKYGQKILEDGPKWHKPKEGTPTMGGIAFLIAAVLSFSIFLLLFGNRIDTRELLVILNAITYASLNFLIGLIDDIAKVKKSENKGLSAKTKFIFQAIVAFLFLFSLHYTVELTTELYIPFLDKTFDIGVLFYALAFLVLCGGVNSVNLTDGIDGLASSVAFSVGLFFSLVGILIIESEVVIFLGSIILGITLGFLFFNFYPAKIFMGDTGSLFLGGIIVATGFITGNILLILLYGFVFVVEAISVIIQVAYFKLSRGKRLLKMAPLHHHFEKSGWSEVKVTSIFTMINVIFCAVALLGVKPL